MATNGSAETSYTVPLLINGKEVITSTTFDVTSPGTGEKVWQSSSASKNDALNAISAAEKALPTWSKTKPAERRAIMLKAADLLEKRKDESFKYISDETGALETFFGFIFDATVEMLRDTAGRIAGALQGEIPVCGREGTSALLLKEPYGVVFSIAPWSVRVQCSETRRLMRHQECAICFGYAIHSLPNCCG
jgi:acyl-CoA reductase-like NAD-dependent aldehyde dehydrogenase